MLVLLTACDQKSEKELKEVRNTQSALNFAETIWNRKALDSLDLFFSDEFVRKVNNIDIATDNADLNASIGILFTAFPDLELTVEDIVASNNSVFLNWNITGANTGIYGDLGPTGKKIKISGMSRIDFNGDGKIIYENVFYNELSLLQQLGYSLRPPNIE